MTSPGDDDGWSYRPFLALSRWAAACVDDPSWRSTVELPGGFVEPDEEHRRQTEAAERLAAVVDRLLDEVAGNPPGGVSIGIDRTAPAVADMSRFQPYSGRQAVVRTPKGQRLIGFRVTVPRDRTDVVELGTDGTDERRPFRARDVVPELRAAVVEQVRGFVVRSLAEATADLLR